MDTSVLIEERGAVGAVAERYLEAGRHYAAAPDSSVHLHHLTTAAELPPEVNLDTAIAAVKAVVRACPAARARFEKTEGWRHVIPATAAIDQEIIEIRADDEDWDNALRTFIVEFNHVPFRLEEEALYKVRLITNGRRIAHVSKIHHILCDGYSAILMGGLLRSFARKAAGEGEFESFTPAQDYLAVFDAEHAHLATATAQANVEWFRRKIGDHPLANGPLIGRSDGWLQTLQITFPPDQTQRLFGAAIGQGAPLSVLTYTIFAQALQRALDTDDVLTCFQKLNRSANTVGIVADLSDLLLVRYREPIGGELRTGAAAAASAIREAKAHWEPYWRVVQDINPEKYFAPMGISPYLYNYLNVDLASIVDGPMPLRPIMDVLETRCTLFDFLCNVVIIRASAESPPVLSINLRYNDAVFDTALANGVRDDIRDAMTRLLAAAEHASTPSSAQITSSPRRYQ